MKIIRMKKGYNFKGEGEKIGVNPEDGAPIYFWKNDGRLKVPSEVAAEIEAEKKQRYEIVDEVKELADNIKAENKIRDGKSEETEESEESEPANTEESSESNEPDNAPQTTAIPNLKKELYDLSKGEQIAKLEKLGVSKEDIAPLKKEFQRVNKLIELMK